MTKKLYVALASLVVARANCAKAGNAEWFEKHEELIAYLARNFLPSGSGFNAGSRVDLDKSTAERLVITTGFHHMSGTGFYCGWTYHDIIVTPSLIFGFNMRLTGKDKNGIKDYIADVFNSALSADVDY